MINANLNITLLVEVLRESRRHRIHSSEHPREMILREMMRASRDMLLSPKSFVGIIIPLWPLRLVSSILWRYLHLQMPKCPMWNVKNLHVTYSTSFCLLSAPYSSSFHIWWFSWGWTEIFEGQWCNSVVAHLPNMHKDLGSMYTMQRQKKKYLREN